MDIARPTPLLGGMSPQAFMRRHWQKKPLLIRQAVPGGLALVSRAELFDLAARDEVEARLVSRHLGRWTLRHGPIARRSLPPLSRGGWTLLVQGLDLHVAAAHDLLGRFRFVPDARLDDLMLSYASDGGGVGPHVDSYDVFLLQTQGRRRWRVGRRAMRGRREATWLPDLPLKILADFEPAHDWLLEPGDMLYLPPGWGHDGVAEGECMTASIGFRAAGRGALARDVLARIVDGAEPPDEDPLYRDPAEDATAEPARVPAALQAFAERAVMRCLADPGAAACALGEVLSEPKPGVWFEPGRTLGAGSGACLDRRSRMLYDERCVYLNGESYRTRGRDGRLVRRLADRRRLDAVDVHALSPTARDLLDVWAEAGWLRACGG